jgi:hypothetical protein
MLNKVQGLSGSSALCILLNHVSVPVWNGTLNDLALADLTQGCSERVYLGIEGGQGARSGDRTVRGALNAQ